MSNEGAYALLKDMVAALELRHEPQRQVAFTDEDRLPSCWPVSDLAAASIAAAAIAASRSTGKRRRSSRPKAGRKAV